MNFIQSRRLRELEAQAEKQEDLVKLLNRVILSEALQLTELERELLDGQLDDASKRQRDIKWQVERQKELLKLTA